MLVPACQNSWWHSPRFATNQPHTFAHAVQTDPTRSASHLFVCPFQSSLGEYTRHTHEVRTHECRRDIQAWREHHAEPSTIACKFVACGYQYMYMSRRPKHTGTIANINTCIGRDDQQNWAETASKQQQIQNWAETASKQLRDCGGVTLRLRPC